MKKIFSYSMLAVTMLFTASCEKGLEDLNVNRTSPTSVDPVLLLNNAVINVSFPVKSLIFDVGAVQHMVTPKWRRFGRR